MYWLTGEKTCLVHGSGHYTEECKLLNEYSENYAAQGGHKETRFVGGGKRDNSIKLNGKTQEVNIMVSHA